MMGTQTCHDITFEDRIMLISTFNGTVKVLSKSTAQAQSQARL